MNDQWLVVGLGNPGPTYERTRHNVGYLVVDELADRMGGRLRRHKATRADVLEGRLGIGGPRVILGRARSYMNESGGPVKALMTYFDVPPRSLVLIHDEIDLPFGGLKVKLGGGDNGHNGLRAVSSAIGTKEYNRVRVGIGRPSDNKQMTDHVLGEFTRDEAAEIHQLVTRSADAVASLLMQGLETTQQSFNNAKT